MTLLALGVVLLAWVRLVLGSGFELGLPETSLDWLVRGRHIAIAATVGVSLSVAGVLTQSMLRNPIASPDILGVAAGAALAVGVASYAATFTGVDTSSFAPRTWHTLPALLGALVALALVMLLSRRAGTIDRTSIVLIGFVISILCGSAIVLVGQFARARGLNLEGRLLFGTISPDISPAVLWIGAGLTALGLVSAWRLGSTLDACALGDDEAFSVGVPIARVRTLVLLLAGTLTAVAVVLAGPIGFVGLICPHAARLVLARGGIGVRHATLVIASALVGVGLMLCADILVRALTLGTGRIPIGVVTALVGGPALILLLRRGSGVV